MLSTSFSAFPSLPPLCPPLYHRSSACWVTAYQPEHTLYYIRGREEGGGVWLIVLMIFGCICEVDMWLHFKYLCHFKYHCHKSYLLGFHFVCEPIRGEVWCWGWVHLHVDFIWFRVIFISQYTDIRSWCCSFPLPPALGVILHCCMLITSYPLQSITWMAAFSLVNNNSVLEEKGSPCQRRSQGSAAFFESWLVR